MSAESPLKVLIVDDEPLAVQNLRSLVEAQGVATEISEELTGQAALEFLAENEVDVLFLDVQMPEMNGFQTLERLDTQKWPVVIFVTAYEQHAVKAFEINALDYLLKPVRDDRFAAAFERAIRMVKSRSLGSLEAQTIALLDAVSAKPTTYLSRIVVRSGLRVRFVSVQDIDYIEALDYYVNIHTPGGPHLLRESMKSLEERLDPSQFARLHRSAILNLDRIKEIRESSDGEHVAVLVDGTKVAVSHTRWRKLQDRLRGRE